MNATQNTTAAKVMKSAWAAYRNQATRTRDAFVSCLKAAWAEVKNVYIRAIDAVVINICIRNKGRFDVVNNRNGKWVIEVGARAFDVQVGFDRIDFGQAACEVLKLIAGWVPVERSMIKEANNKIAYAAEIAQAKASGKDVVISKDFSRATADNDYTAKLIVATADGQIKTAYDKSF